MEEERKRYYAERHGIGSHREPMPFEQVRRLLVSVFDDFRARYYFQEAFGYDCVDAGLVTGKIGFDGAAYFLRAARLDNVFPWWEEIEEGNGYETWRYARWQDWDEVTTLTMVEVLYDLVSAPVDGRYHDYADCGWHYRTFDRPSAQEEFRAAINQVLSLGEPAYELDANGLVVERIPDDFRPLVEASVPYGTDHDEITSRIEAAIRDFRARGATIDDRRHAVRDLADVLEMLRPSVKEHMLSADENALFQLANGFAIRHHNRKQRGDYDRLTWLRWAFYVYLATIHAVLRVRDAQ